MNEKQYLTKEKLSIDFEGRYGSEYGAVVHFYGVVRDLEGGRMISGIEYTAYPEMAEKVLSELELKLKDEFEAHVIKIQHRVGFVPVGEPSLLIEVHTKHSAKAFEISQSYLSEIKQKVPIWKKPIYV
jgi:molybdopterin synthase catalytic subunit